MDPTRVPGTLGVSVFFCNSCGTRENTALCNYWLRQPGEPALCSHCDPLIAKWHNVFPYEPKLAPQFRATE